MKVNPTLGTSTNIKLSYLHISKPFQVPRVSGKKILISPLNDFHTYVPPFLGLNEYRPYMDAKHLEKNSPLIRTRSFKEDEHIFSGSRERDSHEVLIPLILRSGRISKQLRNTSCYGDINSTSKFSRGNSITH